MSVAPLRLVDHTQTETGSVFMFNLIDSQQVVPREDQIFEIAEKLRKMQMSFVSGASA